MTSTAVSPAVPEIAFLGARARIVVDGRATDGAFALVDMLDVPAGNMPPLHVHHREDEGFYLVEGELSLFLPGREIVCRPGDHVVAPRGVPHTYRVGDTPARWLVTSNPAGFEAFVTDVGALARLDAEALTAVAATHGIEILGPPGAMPA